MGGSWLASLFFLLTGFILLGLLWVRVARPVLEDFGILAPVNDLPEPATPPAPRYVVQPEPAYAPSAASRQEAEAEAETEGRAEAAPAPANSTETAYIRLTQKQLDDIKARARLEGQAHAFGTLQGAGFLDAVVAAQRLTAAKEAVFGTSGRVVSAANKLIAEAAAEAERPAADGRVIPIADGREGYVELTKETQQ